ncbi:MAG: SAM-dependent methyltransferase [Arthrobacter sp.]|jgi:LmbE family N-acetylglucosaminyl deacetylase/SAM-dependent methyltransferase|nr:SAM-dependent methyltransferase [Arthrobacter sp.]MCU1555375.1 SAM-dependent methyltransferase [Arthrobacter sp.]
MVSFTHHDPGTEEEAWAGSGLPMLPELPLDEAELAGMAFVIIAAHPDDESLGAGGLMARLHDAGADTRVLLCTAGEASHPGSPTTTPEQLSAVRLREFRGALAHLVPEAAWQYLGLPDGKLAAHRNAVRSAVQQAVADAAAASGRPAERIILVAPYRHDGHADHDVLGSVAAEVAAAGGHGLLEYPIWYWLWAAPAAPAWQSWRRLPLSRSEQHAKATAMGSHTSQVQALSGQAGDEVLLPPAFLQHFERSFETYAWSRPAALPAGVPGGSHAAADAEGIFDVVHQRSDDPWNYTTSWYEQRKRSLTLAALPKLHYEAGLEIGCSIGTLSVELAPRCGTYLAVDASSAALAHALKRLAHLPAAQARQLTVPQDWPEGSFDLIVVSEVGYYLAPAELDELFARVEISLRPGGTLVLCHWRHPISGWELDGDGVHAAAHRQLGWADGGLYRERDFLLEVLIAPEGGRENESETEPVGGTAAVAARKH